VQCQFSAEKVKGQGHRTSNASAAAINIAIVVANNKKYKLVR